MVSWILVLKSGDTLIVLLLSTLCGSTILAPVRSMDSDMTLVFRSDSSVTRRGFEARITFTGGISRVDRKGPSGCTPIINRVRYYLGW